MITLLCGCLTLSVGAAPEDAVVRIPSHGGSGTVIATGTGWSLILTCRHCFEGPAARRPIEIDVPTPTPHAPRTVGVRLVAVATGDADLALVRLGYGPLPYVAPVAPETLRASHCWSVGYDEMRLPAQKRPATIARHGGSVTLTYERPWHGRSGGALIERHTGYLVGVVSAYEGPSNRAERQPPYHGVYVSHAAILRFLRQHGYLAEPSPDLAVPAQPLPRPLGPAAPT